MTDKEIQAAIHEELVEGIRKSLLANKKAGCAISVWRNGRVEYIPPEEIEVDDPTAGDGASTTTRT